MSTDFASTSQPTWRAIIGLQYAPPLFRSNSAGPGAFAGETDRRTVGRRGRRLQVGNFPYSGRNGTENIAIGPQFLERGRRQDWRGGLSPDRKPGSLSARGRRPYASINFVTAHDGFTLNDLSATTRNTTSRMAKRTATATTTITPGTTDSKARPTSPRLTCCASGSAAIFSRRCFFSRASRCSAAEASGAGPKSGTTTPTVRTTRSVGLTGRATKSKMRFLSSREIDTAGHRTSGFSSPEILRVGGSAVRRFEM